MSAAHPDRTKLGGKKVAISILFSTVMIEVMCGDDYEATILFEDLIDRLRRGEGITLSLSQPEPPK